MPAITINTRIDTDKAINNVITFLLVLALVLTNN